MAERRYHDAEWLERQYHGKGLTQREIAEECDVHPSTIRDWMDRLGIETRDMVGENHPLYGKERSEDVKERISETLEGREFSEETRRRMAAAQEGNVLPKETRKKISDSLTGITRSMETREKMSVSTSGEANPRWKGGYSADTYGIGWYDAREQVRERDEICQVCGDVGDGNTLEVHHITPYRLFDKADLDAEIAHELGNLILLCRSCHRRVEVGSIHVEPDWSSIDEQNRPIVLERWIEHRLEIVDYADLI